MNVLQRIWVVVVSTLAAYIVGVFYEFFRPALSSATQNTMLVPWFSPGNFQYVLSWLFAIAGCISAVVAVGMAAPPVVKRTAGSPELKAAPPAKPVKAGKGQPKAQANEVPGMPGFDFEQAKAEIKATPGVSPASSAPPAQYGSRPMLTETLPAQLDKPEASASGALVEPPKEPQP